MRAHHSPSVPQGCSGGLEDICSTAATLPEGHDTADFHALEEAAISVFKPKIKEKFMPAGNRMGPNNMGPRTGRGMGYCAGYDRPGYTNPRDQRFAGTARRLWGAAHRNCVFTHRVDRLGSGMRGFNPPPRLLELTREYEQEMLQQKPEKWLKRSVKNDVGGS